MFQPYCQTLFLCFWCFRVLPCVSVPIFGFPIIISSLVPVCVWLLLTCWCFPWYTFYVFISPEFPLSLCLFTRLHSGVFCVLLLKLPLFTLPLVSRVLPDTRPWHLVVHLIKIYDSFAWIRFSHLLQLSFLILGCTFRNWHLTFTREQTRMSCFKVPFFNLNSVNSEVGLSFESEKSVNNDFHLSLLSRWWLWSK